MEFQYVYILVSECGKHRYVGLTGDLKDRLTRHNRGDEKATSKYRPWSIETAISFQSKEKAVAFEQYLKSGSGMEFARKHF